MTLLESAKKCLDLGLSLIPILPQTKEPPIKWSQFLLEIKNEATGVTEKNQNYRRADIAEVQSWIDKGWYLAVLTGEESGVIVVDDDRVKHGLNEWGFASPVEAKSQSMGKHFYFKYDREIHSHNNKVLHIDLKGWHSYALIPPFNGREWLSDPTENFDKLTPIPDEIVRLINSDKLEQGGTREPLRMADLLEIKEGARNDSLYQLGCSVFNKLNWDEGCRVLAGVNSTYKPPLEKWEFDRQTMRAWKFVQDHPMVASIKLVASKSILNNEEVKTYNLTDTGNAELIRDLFKDEIRFDHKRGRWLIWEGHRWKPDGDGKINRLALQATRKRYQEATNISDFKLRETTAKWSIQSEKKNLLDAAIGVLKSLLPIADDGLGWDVNPMVLSCPNGIVELDTGNLRSGRPDERITMSTGIEYNPQATCPRWEQFIFEIFEGNEDLIRYVKKALGYSISGSVDEQVAFFCFGSGQNGKSVLFKTICGVLDDYAYDAPASLFQRNAMATNTNDIAATEGKRFLVSSETLSTAKINEQRLKAWTGGDRVTARHLYKEFITFEPTVKPWLFINHKPVVEDDSYAFWRRVRLIPFNRVFKEAEQDKNLLHKLEQEKTGILAWLVRGCVLWKSEGLEPTPEIVNQGSKSYRLENDCLLEFLDDKCVELEGVSSKAHALFKGYTQWAIEENITGNDLLSRTAFGRRMTDKYKKIVTNKGAFYKGVALKSAEGAVTSGGFDVKFVPEWWVEGQFYKNTSTSASQGELLKMGPNSPLEANNSPLGLSSGISSQNQLQIDDTVKTDSFKDEGVEEI